MTNLSLTNMLANKDIRFFRRKIMHWFDNNKREYPWRQTKDPFKVLIAEMMLRRTKADQVKPVYERIFTEYPDIESFANAEEQKINEIIYPLGLKWRTPAFVLVAREIKDRYQGEVPMDRDKLLGLSGVGDYVAGAVLSIAFGKKEWIVDSNIVRLFRRYFGVKTSSDGRRNKHIIEMAKLYATSRDPRKANLAILDFAALICTPQKPRHEKCPLRINCQFYLQYHDNDIH